MRVGGPKNCKNFNLNGRLQEPIIYCVICDSTAFEFTVSIHYDNVHVLFSGVFRTGATGALAPAILGQSITVTTL